jgi:hypothetical protein
LSGLTGLLREFKQTRDTSFVDNEAVLEVKMKAPLKEESTVPMMSLTIRVYGALVGGLRERGV